MEICLEKTLTFPKIGAMPIITEANAERQYWDESVDNSCSRQTKNDIKCVLGITIKNQSDSTIECNEKYFKEKIHRAICKNLYLNTWKDMLN